MMKHSLLKLLRRSCSGIWTSKGRLASHGDYAKEVADKTSMARASVKAGWLVRPFFNLNERDAFWEGEFISKAPTNRRLPVLASAIVSHERTNFLQIRFASSGGQTSPIGGIIEIPLAQTGEGIADCELLTWHVQEGDYVEEFQPLCEVQSDKATVQITSRYKGKITQINFFPGAIVKVGEALLEMIPDAEAKARHASTHATDNESESDSDAAQPHAVSVKVEQHEDQKILTTPAVRNFARSYGINLDEVTGTGKDGRILKDDVLKFAAAKEGLHEELSGFLEPNVVVMSEPKAAGSEDKLEASSTKKGSYIEDEIIPVRGFRRAMVKTMTAAAMVPHFHYMEEVNMDALVRLRTSLKNVALERNIKLTYLPFLIKALSVALYKHPVVNSTVNDDVSEIRCKASHNIGVAIGKESGLAVPNIKNVQHISIFEIAQELSRLTQLASSNKLSPEDLSGGTITVSNFGAIGGKFGCPVLNLPEVAILGIGRVQKLPRFDNSGHVYPASMMSVTWGADHRVIDGATVANLCNEWKLLVEEPERLIVHLR